MGCEFLCCSKARSVRSAPTSSLVVKKSHNLLNNGCCPRFGCVRVSWFHASTNPSFQKRGCILSRDAAPVPKSRQLFVPVKPRIPVPTPRLTPAGGRHRAYFPNHEITGSSAFRAGTSRLLREMFIGDSANKGCRCIDERGLLYRSLL